MKKVFFSPNYIEISGNKKIKMSRLLTSTIGHTLCSSSSPVLPPPAAVLALALGHGGDLHAVAAIIGPWGSHGDVVLLWPCPATTCMLAMVAACMPWLLDTSFTRSLGFTVFFCSLRSNGFTTSGLQPWQFVYTQTLTFSVTRTLGWEAKQSGPYKYVRVWWCPLSTGSLPPSLWKEFPCHFLFFMCSSNPNTYETYEESVAYLWREQLIHQAAYVWIRRGRWQWIYCGICRKVT